MPQLSWMDVNARDYWVCPGCARLVNRDVNREHRGMPVIGIQPISWQPTDLDRVSDDARRAISSLSEPFACIRPVANAAANFLRIFEYALRCRNQKNRTRWLRQDGNLRFGKLFVLSLCLKRYCPKRYCAQDAGSEACGRSLVAALNRHIQVRGSCVSSNCDRCDGLKQYTSAREPT